MAVDGLYDEQTLETYERGGFGGSLTFGERPAVVVVDFTYGFTDPACVVGSNMDDEVAATRRVLDVARTRGTLVVFTTIVVAADLKDAGLIPSKVPAIAELRVGSRWTLVDDRLDPRDGEVTIVKKSASALFGTNLAAILVTHGIDTVILCGATTSGCVRATAVDLYQLGFPTFVPRDCVADRARGPHDANLFDMQAKYVDVISSDAAIAYLETVGTPAAGGARR